MHREAESQLSSDTDLEDPDGKNAKTGKGLVCFPDFLILGTVLRSTFNTVCYLASLTPTSAIRQSSHVKVVRNLKVLVNPGL